MSKEKQIDDNIYGKYGCWWEGGTGVSPEGNQCGECYPNYEDKCPNLKKFRQIEEMANDLYGYSIDTKEDCEFVAKLLLSKSYRKQSENTVEVVRCKECRNCEKVPSILGTVLYCNEWCKDVDEDTFCSFGAKMKGGAE